MGKFIKKDDIDGEWLSPIESERQYQEKELKKIFPCYPNGDPKWQHLNGLIKLINKNNG